MATSTLRTTTSLRSFASSAPACCALAAVTSISLLWTPSANGTHQQISPTNVKNLAGFLQATGWLCLYAVNLATSTPALAAEEVAFAVSALGESLLGIEIGNEPDEYGVHG